MSDNRSIYIHIPFCVRKCAYCDFYSGTDLSLIPDYLKALETEIGLRAATDVPSNGSIDTIYFGGGTPSLLGVSQIENILQTVRNRFQVSPDVEITAEINPGTVDAGYFSGLKGAGVNRLSIGVQSFNDDKLKFLHRIHNADEACRALDYVKNAGFENISLDLIYGVPGETQASWIRDLKNALERKPSHISAYMLTLEPGTPLSDQMKKGTFAPFDSGMMSSLFKITSQYLNQAGFEHYEISSFSRGTRYRSKHNSRYWDLTPYLGFGAAAHSYDGNIRSWNYKNTQRYITDLSFGRLPVEDHETLTPEQKITEFIMLRLRTLEGISLEEFQERFQLSFENKFKDILGRILDEDLGSIENNRFTLNLEGRTYLNSIVEAFAAAVL
ncbi:MAG: radical SAM family heme chaperone HemW [Desulfobacula sp.]